jgi:signal transduction histidine kinase
MGVLMSFGGLFWGTLALVLGLWLESLIPFGYAIVTTLNFALFHRTLAFERARLLQVFISMLLPFCFQWVLGGFHSSGATMLWAMVALFGSLIFSSARHGLIWLGLFIGLTILSAAIDNQVMQLPAAATAGAIRDYAMLANLIMVCGITFGLTISLMSGRQKTNERLEAANAQILELNAQLSEREANLSKRTLELSESLDALKSTQRELVRSEKLASLGGLVAGVAHEINTPLGVAVTAGSLAREAVEEMMQQVEGNQVKRSALLGRLGDAREALVTLEANIQRGAALIRNFKTVSVDQTADTVRTFELSSYLGEIISSLSPLVKRSNLFIRVEAEDLVEVRTRAGALSQIVTNLVTNAIHHAFDPQAQGELSFTVSRVGDRARLIVQDNGKGMSPEVVEHVFDPFFTTQRGRGGSGLGLFIVHNLVTEGLSGSIRLESSSGNGTKFTLEFPLDCGCG